MLTAAALSAASVVPTTAGSAVDPDAGSREGTARPPNIVIILLDDIPGDVMPRLLRRLPTLRRLFVRSGIRFRNAFVQDPLCCPGRATLLTGLTAGHHRVRDNWAPRFRSGETLATALERVGYHNLIVGKYLNNSLALRDKSPKGWHRVAIFGRGGYHDYDLFVDDVRERYGSRAKHYSTTVLARKARGFLREAPPGGPLFLLFSPQAVHNVEEHGRVFPPVAAPRDVGSRRCDGIGFRKTPAYNERDVSDKPRWIRRIDVTRDPLLTPRGFALRPVCEALLSVDRALAAFVDELGRQGRFGDTLFILTADNGMGWEDHRRRSKSVPWATSVPLYVSWRSGLGNTPGVIRSFAQNIDLAPTLAEAAGASLGPFPTGQDGPDGISLLEVLLTCGATTIPRMSLFEDHQDGRRELTWRGLRTTDQHPRGRWRYTEWATGERELYDLEADPWELENLARSKPKLRRMFGEEVARLARQVNR